MKTYDLIIKVIYEVNSSSYFSFIKENLFIGINLIAKEYMLVKTGLDLGKKIKLERMP